VEKGQFSDRRFSDSVNRECKSLEILFNNYGVVERSDVKYCLIPMVICQKIYFLKINTFLKYLRIYLQAINKLVLFALSFLIRGKAFLFDVFELFADHPSWFSIISEVPMDPGKTFRPFLCHLY
jgi:hypothetical protein